MSYKAVSHLEHADYLEVATYRKNRDTREPIDSITVECTKCGEVVEEIYNADEDNTPPLDCEFPEPDRRTWEEGVKDAARIVQNEMRHKKAIDHPNTRVHPAVFETLNEVELHLAAMLSRGSYESHDTVMQGENPRWLNNEVQFARLLCELIATQDRIDYQALSASMNLSAIDVDELFSRAHEVWEKAKASACPPKP